MTSSMFLIICIVSLAVISSGQAVLGYGGPPVQSSANNYTVEIISDSDTYELGDTVMFSGTVNKYDEDRRLRITIFDSGNSLIVTQKTVVNLDGTFSHDILLNEKFSDGKFMVKTQYGNSKSTVAITSFEIVSMVFSDVSSSVSSSMSSETSSIPSWVKNNAGWWASGQIDDDSFVSGIQFLIKKGFMSIPATEQGASSQGTTIPSWVKNNAGWWASGQIDDDSFVSGIQFLIKKGFMSI